MICKKCAVAADMQTHAEGNPLFIEDVKRVSEEFHRQCGDKCDCQHKTVLEFHVQLEKIRNPLNESIHDSMDSMGFDVRRD